MKITYCAVLSFILICSGCATYQNDKCPSIALEPVSGCRARLKCQVRNKTNYTIGLRSPTALVPDNYGIDMGQSPVTENFNECVSRNLQEQDASRTIIEKGNP